MIKQHLYAITYGRCFGPEAQADWQIKNPAAAEAIEIYRNMSKDLTYQNCLDAVESRIAEAEMEVRIIAL
jgi:hypothetical protein